MTGILPLMHRQDHPLAPVVALSVADDGARRYDQVDPSKVIRGTELAPYLPRELWHAYIDASCRSNASRYSTKSGVKEHTCPVCLDELREGCLVSRFSCSHVLHFECACSWLSSRIRAGNSGTCPLWFAPPRSHLPLADAGDLRRKCRKSCPGAFCMNIASRGTRTWRKQLTFFAS